MSDKLRNTSAAALNTSSALRPWIERGFFADIAAIVRQRGLAWQLYLAEIAESHRSAGLGILAPFASVALYSAVLGSIMALVFGQPVVEFIPFFAVSFPLWQAVSSFVVEAAYGNEKSARYLSFPNISAYIVHLVSIYSFLISTALKFISAIIVIIVVNPGVLAATNWLGTLAGILFVSLVLFTWALPIAHIFDRIRLLRAFLPQLLLAGYLITPILWQPDRVATQSWIYELNPVFHLVQLVREPVLAGVFPIASLAVCLGVAIVGLLASIALFQANRRLVVYGWIA
jgi:ABC-type polysaccharide/polyol phosphate export permease